MTVWASARNAWRVAKQAVPDRPDLAGADDLRYLRSYLLLRVMIGSIGLALPVVTWLGSALLPGGSWSVKESLSDYYYSGMREVFTGSLFAVGVFLVAYKVFEPTIENVLTMVSGFAATLVAFFPTGVPSGAGTRPTPLQTGLGESHVTAIHYVSATVFILSLAVLSHFFAAQEGNRAPVPGRRSPAFWKRIHDGCAIAIVAACGYVAVSEIPAVSQGSWLDGHHLWLGEVVAVVAFGTSWLCKGFELDYLLRRQRSTGAAA